MGVARMNLLIILITWVWAYKNFKLCSSPPRSLYADTTNTEISAEVVVSGGELLPAINCSEATSSFSKAQQEDIGWGRLEE